MTNFKSAFETGLQLVQKAEAAKKEINEVFAELNRQLSEVSEGKLVIERKQKERRSQFPFAVTVGLFQQPELYWAITARNPKIKDSPIKELAEWKTDRHGYPCKLTWEGEESYCENRQSLEKSLERLLQDPVAAETLFSVIHASDTGK